MPHSRFISDYLTSSKNVVKYGCQFTFRPMNEIIYVLIVFREMNEFNIRRN